MKLKHFLLLLTLSALFGCTGLPKGITPVKNFDADKYLGTWYEIARLDHSFERGLDHVSATYSEKDDGGIKVVNRGRNPSTGEVKVAEGKAYFVQGRDVGYLKVSFFGPFYGSYVVFELEEKNYDYAFVTSHTRDYLWLLARKPEISDEVREKFLKRAKELKFDTDSLIFVDQK